MTKPESQLPVVKAAADDAISPASEAAPNVVDVDSKSSLSSDGAKDAKLADQTAPINVVPHLVGTSDGDDVTLVDAQSGAVGATWKHRVPALLMILFFTLGSNFAQSSLSPLKSTIKKQMPEVTNARYGALASAEQLVNGVLPLFSGIMIDYYGPSITSLLSSSAILLGTIVRAIGGHRESFPTILAGQIIFGLGSTTIETSQSKLYTHWCRDGTSLTLDAEDKEQAPKSRRFAALSSAGWLGFVYGLDIAMGRVFNVMGKMSSIPVAESTGKWYWTFWLSAILCAVTLGFNTVYVIYERSLPKRMRVVTGRQLAAQADAQAIDSDSSLEKKTTKPWTQRHLRLLTLSVGAIPASFWLITMTQILQAGSVNAYNANLPEVVQITRGKSKLMAGYASSVGQVPPIVLTPLLGLMFDLFGRRMYYVSGCAALWVVVFALLAYTQVNAYVPVVLGSIALSFNALPFLASIPLLVPNQASIGTAFGIWKCFNSAGSVTMDVAFGAIQDRTPTGKNQFNNAFAFLIALKAIDVLYGLSYHFIDKRYFGGVLKLNERQLLQKMRSESEEERSQALRKPVKKWTTAGCVLLAAFVTTGYVLYITYSIGT
ncbi:Major facilitator superfamily [Kalmanozyma brasiliensis GHG001]|uniref:Lysosomal dipeptide transporter MFSD1 n=1 Tax=Kalmanozyma brasiliensis (strain GHG001) TaxID=1365824 RepID=V5EX42_KALBG|nr:Major facilitator superfamily [Kalmanozyma brasiliensis GHG001]EST10225.1 Major facilitator superfamily [Kalmanozyma brasiliensis GHG001]